MHDSRIDGGQDVAPSNPGREKLFSDQPWDFLTEVCTGVPVHRVDAQTSLGGSHIHKAVVQTILGLLYRLSNKSLDDESSQALRMIIRAPSWDAVLPYLRDVLDVIDTHIIQAIAEGLFKEGIETCCQRMLELSLSLGADPKQRISYDFGRKSLSTPMVVLCDKHKKRSSEMESQFRNPERLILSLLERETHVSNGTLIRIISASCHAIAERIIRSQPERTVDFTIAKSDLEGGPCFRLATCHYDPVTPLLVACWDERQSDEKLSLIHCLLDRKAKADLKVMSAAARAYDWRVVSLLHQFGAPVDGFIPGLGSPLSSACEHLFFHIGRCDCNESPVIRLLLSLGASPNCPINRNADGWGYSPFHVLARAKEEPAVIQALSLLIEHSAGMLKHAHVSGDGQIGKTALECAIENSHWISAFQLLSADCDLTGREMLLIDSDVHHQRLHFKDIVLHRRWNCEETVQRRFRRFFSAFLEKAPMQTAVLDWSGLTVLQRAIQNENEGMILALLEFGLTSSPSDFLCMLPKSLAAMLKICSLSSSVQMKLLFASGCPETSILDISVIRIILAFACPEVIRHILNLSPDIYDSEGLCYVIARFVSKDRTSYFPDTYQQYHKEENQTDSITLDDLQSFISRRTISKRNEDWESTAITIAARAGRTDILRVLTESSQGYLRESGLIPRFLLQKFLEYSTTDLQDVDKYNLDHLGLWIRYCRMKDPSMRCSPLTAAVMVVPETAAEETFDLLLALNYKPDGWTVLVASCQGRISILQRLRVFECWPHILRHEDRPDWCPTALQAAVFNARDITVKFLLEAGTVLNEADLPPCRPICITMPGELDAFFSTTILPRTALQHAVDKESTEMAILLVNSGANVNAPAGIDSGATALQIASIQGSIPMVTYLINRGANPFAPGAVKHGRTAVQGAAEHGRKDVVELLLAHGKSTPHQHREQLVKAVFYAVKNAQHVVANILRERLHPPWSSEDEDTFEMFTDDWESSSENSAFIELRDKFSEWEGSSEDGSELSWESDSHPISDMASEEEHVENPVAFQEDEVWSLQEMEETVEGLRDLDVRQIGEIDLYDGGFGSGLALQEENAYWIEGQPSFEGYGVDDTLLEDFSFDGFI